MGVKVHKYCLLHLSYTITAVRTGHL